jgi:hypothetical protein
MANKLDISKLIVKCLLKKNVYFRMPKVASETITKGLTTSTAVIPHCYFPKTIQTIFRVCPLKYKFSFVRHPVSRFISAYNWAMREKIEGNYYHLDVLQKKKIQECGDINAFLERLPYLLRDKSTKMIHFYPQSDYLYSGSKCLVDFVGKAEGFESSIALSVRLSVAFKI